jgi:4-amino-4-deoxy-L-arabinose transferase-like glycosyltransferase
MDNHRKLISHIVILVILTVACLVPFSDKAFHIDDPLFIWAARHIQNNPVDFYGFNVNWYGWEGSMAGIAKNPPLTSYYIAFVASIAGWSERVLHLFFLLTSIGVVIGTYFLAKRFCSMPFQASLIAMTTPAFLVSGTTVMSDMMMLAFWCWAVVLWVRGTDRSEPLTLMLSSILIALSALTKYFGMSLIPLLCAYSLFYRHRIKLWAPWMLIPVLLLAGYQWATHDMYGRGMLLDAIVYATDIRLEESSNLIEKGFIGMVFAGGCYIITLFYVPMLLSRRTLFACACLMAAGAIVLVKVKVLGGIVLINEEDVRWDLIIQLIVFAVTGIVLLGVSIADFLTRRDPSSLLFVLWVMGTLVFASFFNWTTSGRSMLPIVPVAGILLMRKAEQRSVPGGNRNLSKLFLPLIPGLFIAIMVTWADYSLANSARTAAGSIYERYSNRTSNIWFQGHWGFQYYMEKAGAKAVDFTQSHIAPGDIIVIPLNNTNLKRMPKAANIETVRFSTFRWLASMSAKSGAGFYLSGSTPLPYVFGPTYNERYLIMYARDNIMYAREIIWFN